MTEVQRYKSEEELSDDELLAVVRARHAGEPEPKFETAAYKQAKTEALEDAGLEPDADAAEPVPVEDQTVAERLAAVQEANR